MDILKNKTDHEIAQSLLAEIAKANNEINCATNDLNKARNRLSFCIAALNTQINRREINGSKTASTKTTAGKSNG